MANKKNNPIWVNHTEEEERLSAEEKLIVDVAEDFWEILEKEGISRKELADRMGKKKSDISQLLSGDRNLSLRTIADIAFYLGHEANLKFRALKRSVTEESGPSGFEVSVEEQGWTSLYPETDGIKSGHQKGGPGYNLVFEIPREANEEFSDNKTDVVHEWFLEDAHNG